MAPHPGVARKINISCRAVNDVTAPERGVAVTQPPPRKMLRRHAGHIEFVRDLRRFPPIKFDSVVDLAGVEERTIPETAYKPRLMLCLQSNQCRDIQMIVMVMADEHDIDWRQVFEP